MAAEWSGDELGCEVVWILIQGFVGGDSNPEAERLMRAHTAHCGDCRDQYRSAIVTAARIGGEHRKQRVAQERVERRRNLRRAALQASEPPSGRFHRARTLLYPAFFAFLMFQVSRITFNVEGVSVTCMSGQVLAQDVRLEPGVAQHMVRGAWCETRPDSEARLTSSTCSATLGPESSLLVERARPTRFRLHFGTVDIDGACTLSTSWGVLDLAPGGVRVTIAEGRTEIAVVQGEVTLTGPGGATRLPVGSSRTWGSASPLEAEVP